MRLRFPRWPPCRLRGLANALWLSQQLRQLGDIHRDPPCLIAREQLAADRRQALAYVYLEDERGGRAIVIGTRLR